MNEEDLSVTQILTRLKGGDERAAELIWRRFFERVAALARAKMGSLPKRALDEEDITLSAMNAFYHGVSEGRFHKLEDREDLWQLLCMLTSRKVANAWRKQASSKLVGESAVSMPQNTQNVNSIGLEYIAEKTPDDGYVDSLSQLCNERLEGLDERLREVALLRLHGYSNQEIASKIGRSIKSVERYLKSIRQLWLEQS